jgi:hypothetical protein
MQNSQSHAWAKHNSKVSHDNAECRHQALSTERKADGKVVGGGRHVPVLEEKLSVVTDNTGLIGLGNVCENDIDHIDEHTIAQRITSVLVFTHRHSAKNIYHDKFAR